MSNKAVVDSNIWIYLKSQDAERRIKAEKLFNDDTLAIFISTQILEKIYTVLTKKKFASHADAKNFLVALSNFYPVLTLTTEHITEALKLVEEYSFNYWDALIVATALLAEVKILYSEDMQNGLVVRNNLTIVNPFKDL